MFPVAAMDDKVDREPKVTVRKWGRVSSPIANGLPGVRTSLALAAAVLASGIVFVLVAGVLRRRRAVLSYTSCAGAVQEDHPSGNNFDRIANTMTRSSSSQGLMELVHEDTVYEV